MRTRQVGETEVAFYRDNGYLLVEGVLDDERLQALRRLFDDLIVKAGNVAANDEVYDLEDSHQPNNPRVRRIKEPHRFPLVRALAGDPRLTNHLVPLIGPDIRLYGSKLNMKSAGYGAPVEWHQDWAFYPHTNDDILATGILLDDCDEANGPLLVAPGSHRGPTFDHHHQGHFAGAMDIGPSRIDPGKAVALTGPAGSMTVHHVRAVHGSALNHSNRQRRLLLFEYAAADAWPLMGMRGGFEEFNARMVRGNPTIEPRIVPAPVRMPLPPAPNQGSIYENQKGTGERYFAMAAGG
ncbi:MAG: phytanoyl-CoA dioxygenase family protein [Alphaproteobacteria bacterium]|nr:phytanoyl-CoA dioxygenase family protein [Alphaproteobacteria bacterium]